MRLVSWKCLALDTAEFFMQSPSKIYTPYASFATKEMVYVIKFQGKEGRDQKLPQRRLILCPIHSDPRP